MFYYEFLYLCGNGCYLPSFISYFVYLDSLYLLMNLAKHLLTLVLFKEIKNIQSPDYYICSSKPSIFPFSPVRSLSRVQLFVTPWTAVRQASLSINNFQGLFTLMSIRSVMPSNHLILCNPLFLLPSIDSRITVFSNESVLHIRCAEM